MWSKLIRADPLQRFRKSRFRRSFALDESDIKLIKQFGMQGMHEHSINIIRKNLKNRPYNDGKQTPYYGHPVFKAMHATACCCRKCVERWHRIPRNKVLDDKEVDFLAGVICKWLKNNMPRISH